MSKSCINCSEVLDDKMLFCVKCGTKQPIVKNCTNCGSELADNAVFCTECGTKVEQSMVENDASETSAKHIKKIIAVVLGVCLLIGMIMAFSSGSGENTSKNETAIVQTVKAKDLIDDYIRDYSSAESKYKNAKVKVTGKVLNKGQFQNSTNFYVTLYSESAAGKEYTLLVNIPADNVSDINKVKHGDFITIEGTCVGSVKQENATDISVQIVDSKINQ